MDKKVAKFKKLFPQESFIEVFNSRSEIQTLFELLTLEEIDKLLEVNSVFIRSCAPSSKVDLQQLSINGLLTLINFDSNYYRPLLPQEFIGVLLHEIGHVLHADKKGIEGEYAADKFANDKGYGYWIIQGLQKGLRNKWMGFEQESCNLRIARLNELGPTNIKRDDEEEYGDEENKKMEL